MHHHKTYLCINFQHNRVETQVVTVLTSLLVKKIARIYMHINFHQTWANRSVNDNDNDNEYDLLNINFIQ